ncbi:tetratricopeptide repeat protein 37-like [Ornithodoros turicata]|uniref:tetratricopeptide repeat protein 37-like n=1 Tax=Ornithodoros turicata TaxID=34597 RepID=UPI003139D406
MDSKELKKALKDARDALRDKDYKAALKHCKAALKADKNCYTAWVFVGAAAQEIDELEQAVAAFRKAIDIQPDQLLAWQGLCALYEKRPEVGDLKNDRHEVYLKLVELTTSDPAKQAEFVDKLTDNYKNAGDAEMYVAALKQCSEYLKMSPEVLKVWHSLLDFITQKKPDLSESAIDLVIHAYREVVFSASQEVSNREDLCRAYLEFLSKCNQKELAKQEADKFGSAFPNSTLPLEMLCRTYIDENIVLSDPNPSTEISNAVSGILEKEPKSEVVWLCKGMQLYACGNYTAAVEALSKASAMNSESQGSWLMLAKCALKLHRYGKAEEWSSKGLSSSEQCAQENPVRRQLLLCLAEAFRGQFNFVEALKVIEKLKEDREDSVLLCSCRIYLDYGKLDMATEVIQKLRAMAIDSLQLLECEGSLLLQQGDFAAAEEILRNAVDKNPSSASTLHLLAVAQLKLGATEQAVKNLCKAAQLDPNDHRNYLLLGRNYYFNLKDNQKALRCFQKAFKLNMLSEESGSLLSDVLRDLGENDQNVMFLKAITSQMPIQKAKWAWLRLGLIQMQQDALNDAVQSLQNALRADPKNKHYWECLGEVYLRRKSLAAALMSFKKCLELDPQDFFSLYQIANIKKEQEEYKEATIDYRKALDVNPDYVPALKGCAEAHLLLARQYLTQSLYGLALDSCQAALDSLGQAVPFARNLVCLWKLLADICLLPAVMGISDYRLHIPGSLLDENVWEDHPDRDVLLVLAERFIMKALTLRPKIAGLWQDLGLSYYLQGVNGKDDAFHKALVSVQKAVSLNPRDPAGWNMLGVVAQAKGVKRDALAQHCFIKSVQLESSNPVAWANLGALYLVNNNVKLAHSAFSMAQSQDPSHVRAWVGQALVAEKVGHHDTMDLFRHCTLLGNHPEAATGYARWVCRTTEVRDLGEPSHFSIPRASVLANACDALIRARGCRERAPHLLNMLGILFEKQGLLGGAEEAYKSALGQLLSAGSNENTVCVRINLSRVLCKSGKPQEAMHLLSGTERSKEVLCALGQIYTKLGQHEDAYQAYDEALLQCSEGEKADIVLAIASVTRHLRGIDDAKEVLMERMSSAGLSTKGLVMATCYGLLTLDDEVANEALRGLEARTANSTVKEKASFLAACKLHLKGNFKAARNSLCRSLLHDPTSGVLWCQLAQLLLDEQSVALAGRCAQTALVLGDCLDRVFSLLVLGALTQHQVHQARSAAQKLVFIYPDRLHSWILLGTVLCVSPKDSRCDKALQLDRFLTRGDVDSSWKLWSSLLQIHYAVVQQQWKNAKELIDLVLWGYCGSPETAKDLEVLGAACEGLAFSNKPDALQKAAKVAESNGVGATGWLAITKLQQRCGKFIGALDSASRASDINSTENRVITMNLRKAYLTLQLLKIDATQREQHLAAVLKYLSAALKLNPRCKAGHLLLAIWALESKNTRLMKKSLERVLRLGHGDSWLEKTAAQLLAPVEVV